VHKKKKEIRFHPDHMQVEADSTLSRTPQEKQCATGLLIRRFSYWLPSFTKEIRPLNANRSCKLPKRPNQVICLRISSDKSEQLRKQTQSMAPNQSSNTNWRFSRLQSLALRIFNNENQSQNPGSLNFMNLEQKFRCIRALNWKIHAWTRIRKRNTPIPPKQLKSDKRSFQKCQLTVQITN